MQMQEQPVLTGMTLQELETLFRSLGEPSYRARQLFHRLYRGRLSNIHDATELSLDLRTQLQQCARVSSLSLAKVQQSQDGTKKMLFRLADGREIETVLIPSETTGDNGEPKRLTLCVSTQVGCAINCVFCATARLKIKRNLTTGEIIDQFVQSQRLSEKPITNLVFMGMGEPLLNYDNVMNTVELLTHPELQLLGAKRITLSTSGIVDGIRRMADEQRPIKLALSLHASTNGLRSALMPINKKWDLRALGDALEYYYRKTRQAVTYEYIVFDELNDSSEDINRLIKISRRVPSKINVIPFHPINFIHPEGLAATLKPTTPEKFRHFIGKLRDANVTVMIRSSSGKDIHAACGQLALSQSVHEPSPV